MALIIVVEDNVHSAKMVAKLLRPYHTILLAENGEDGLVTMFEHHPDLVLLDLGLPDIDGQTVIGLAREKSHLMNIPIIAFTAWPKEEACEMARNYDFDGIILKPINTRTFAAEITKYLYARTKPQAASY